MIAIRSFAQTDLDDAFALDQLCFAPGIAYSKTVLRYFVSKPAAFAIVAEQAGRMAGFVVAEWSGRLQKPAHLITIDVEPAARRSGVATRLMDAAETHYSEAGCEEMSLEVAVDNLSAQSFYSGRGFRVTGRRPGYYNGVLDAFTMRKGLRTDKDWTPTS